MVVGCRDAAGGEERIEIRIHLRIVRILLDDDEIRLADDHIIGQCVTLPIQRCGYA